jgi:hypothetical protein
VIANIETYDNPIGFVTYINNPIGGVATGVLAWVDFTLTITFSGLKRPGATEAKKVPASVTNPVSLPGKAILAEIESERGRHVA